MIKMGARVMLLFGVRKSKSLTVCCLIHGQFLKSLIFQSEVNQSKENNSSSIFPLCSCFGYNFLPPPPLSFHWRYSLTAKLYRCGLVLLPSSLWFEPKTGRTYTAPIRKRRCPLPCLPSPWFSSGAP